MVELSLIPKDYNIDMALDNKDIINYGAYRYNIDRLDQFIYNVNNNIPDKIRITDFGIDSPSYKILQYNGNEIILTIKYYTDNEPNYLTYYGYTIIKRIGKKHNKTILYYDLIQFDNDLELPIFDMRLM
ncbi:MAG: hypothetical protein K0S41_3760 [Anaerocolumna sp.]|jgi:predicted Zn-dependent protease with MMP-like domain|nr:hypothetical protein [Anaerocolumna sp.]